MRCECFTTVLDDLPFALTEAALLQRYRDWMQVDIGGLAEPGLVRHVQQLLATCDELAHFGWEQVAQQKGPQVDALLVDIFAAATWFKWPLAVTPQGERDLTLDSMRPGILGLDHAKHGPLLYLIEPDTIALCRQRVVEEQTQPKSPLSP